MTNIIVSSPHRVCRRTDIRDCDRVSGLAADIITKRLGAVGITGNEYRMNYDLNRSSTRDTSFRKALAKVFHKYHGEAILLDIHSFPNYYFDKAGDINFFNKGETPPDLVIMTGPDDKYGDISISYELFLCLKSQYKVKIITDIEVLDILNHSSEYSIPGVLLEFNEKYSQDTKQLYRLCNIICNCIAKFRLYQGTNIQQNKPYISVH